MIVKAEMSPTLQLARRPKEPMVVFWSESEGLKPQELMISVLV